MRVLLVDDYPGLVELYDLALRARGFDIVGAATAGEAMTLAATERFDAVVLDVELPDGSGAELVDRMRAIPTLQTAHFIGISSYQGREVGKALGLGHGRSLANACWVCQQDLGYGP